VIRYFNVKLLLKSRIIVPIHTNLNKPLRFFCARRPILPRIMKFLQLSQCDFYFGNAARIILQGGPKK